MERKLKIIFISVFMAIICLPVCVGALVGADIEALHREPTPLPTFRGINYLCDYEDFITDRLAFKGGMIEVANAFNILLLKDNRGSDILYGDQGYFFYAQDYTRQDMLGERILTQEELAQIADKQISTADFLAEKGIKYLIVIVPDKQSVYSEFVPYGMYRQSDNRVKDQVVRLLRDNGNIEILDLTEAFRNEKANQPLYLKTDGHWNYNGSFLAYQEITKKLRTMGFQNVPLVERDAYEIIRQENHPAGNLVDILKLTQYVTEENSFLYTKKNIDIVEAQIEGYHDPSIYPIEAGYGMRAYEKDDKTLPKAVILKDSFGGVPGGNFGDVEFLAEDFSRSVFFSTSAVDFSIIETENPDIVIVQVAEYLLSSRLAL